MTNNHCPKNPARILKSRANEVKIRDFAEHILDQINEFGMEFAINDGIAINADILDTWSECAVCESRIQDCAHEIQKNAISEIMDFLEANLDR